LRNEYVTVGVPPELPPPEVPPDEPPDVPPEPLVPLEFPLEVEPVPLLVVPPVPELGLPGVAGPGDGDVVETGRSRLPWERSDVPEELDGPNSVPESSWADLSDEG
jgi:hypothetical protein